MSEKLNALPDTLFSQMQNEKFVLLHTVDAETGSPTSSAISWVYAVDPGRIRFALDARSRLLDNLRQHERASMTIFGNETVHAIYGKAELVSESLEDVPFKLSCYDIVVEDVRDAMFYGSKLKVEPEYEKTYDKRAAEKLDQQVFTSMKKA